jgi:hypothetical protein
LLRLTQVNAAAHADRNAARMPDAPEILAGLARLAAGGWPLAAGWHAAALALLIALLRGWRPGATVLAALLAVPLACVAVLAFASGNPFNGTIFALLAAGSVPAARHGTPEPATGWTFGAGLALFGFAWFYPHFLSNPVLYLIAAPMGLIPCPTLAAVGAFGLLTGGLGSRSWSWLVGATGVFYGLVGILRLGVWLDTVLLAGAVALLLVAARPARAAPSPLDSGGRQ